MFFNFKTEEAKYQYRKNSPFFYIYMMHITVPFVWRCSLASLFDLFSVHISLIKLLGEGMVIFSRYLNFHRVQLATLIQISESVDEKSNFKKSPSLLYTICTKQPTLNLRKKRGRWSKIYASSLLLLPLKNFFKQHPSSYPPKIFYV